MKNAREIEILFRRLRLYDQLGLAVPRGSSEQSRERCRSAMEIEHVRSEIEHMRVQLGRQRKKIVQLQRAGISTASAELLMQRMLVKIEAVVTSETGSRRSRAVQ